MNKEKRQLLDKTFQTFMEVGLGGVNLELLDDIVAMDVVGFGTTIDEKIFGIKELQELLVRQKEQSAGMEVSWKINTLDIHISSDENTAIFTNDLIFYITVDGNTIEMYMRFSVVLEYVQNKWLVVHWHGSKPENVESAKDTWGIETWKEKAEALEKEVAARTADLVEKNRELQIEAALERVRAKAMAMQKSGDLRTVVVILYEQLKSLGFQWGVASIVIMDPDSGDMDWWMEGLGDGFELPERYHVPYFEHSGHLQQLENWKSGRPYAEIEISGQEKKTFDAYYFSQTDFSHAPEQSKQLMMQGESLRFSMAFMKYGALSWAPTPLLKEQASILEHFAKVFEQCYTRFLDLQKAEAQTREAQIEVAIERVRAQSMAMHQPDDLDKVNKEILKQLQWLQVKSLTGVSIWLMDVNGWVKVWDLSSPGNMGDPNSYSVQYDAKKYDILGEPWRIIQKSDQSYFVLDYPTERLGRAIKEWEDVDPVIANDFRQALTNGKLTHQWNPFARLSNGLLSIDLVNPPTEDTKTILLKMAGAFNLAYQRFLDLQKAEAQAREAQIEAALERIRSKSLAMYKTNDLREVVVVLFDQLQGLSVDMGFASVSIFIFEEGSKNINQWLPLPDGVASLSVPYFEHSISSDLVEARESGVDYFAKDYTVQEKNTWLEKGFMLTDYKDLPEEFKTSLLEAPGYAISISLAKNSGICIPSFVGKYPSDEDVKIMKRMGKVFEQAYIRFLDLQKAETQARVAQIEAALERTRTQSMLMQHSNELNEISKTFHEQLLLLGIDSEFSFVWLPEEDKQQHMFWATWISNVNGIVQFHSKAINYSLDKTEPGTAACYVAWESGQPVHETFVPPGEIYSFFASWEELLSGANQLKPELFPDGIYYTEAYMKYGCFGIDIRRKLTDDEKEILRRFSVEFERTYTRFLDLKKAEAQAIEATKQASLDRIRGEIASMRSAEDLEIIPPLVWNELTTLGIPFVRCGVFIVDEKKNNLEVYLSTPGGKSLAGMNLPFGANEMTSSAVEAWEKEKVHVHQWSQTDFINWNISMKEQSHGTDLQTYQGADVAPESLHLHFVPFTQGLLYVGSTETLSEEQINMVKALARSFAIAYARYEDFVKLEQAKVEVEHAMSHLKATQSQLVQQEKLASLGQLTAGIAHEIKNPLNFVNNFSEVSIELIQEALEEIVKTQHAASPIDQNNGLDEIIAILDDVQSNLTKIHEHGSRANGIVTSMLQHSRGGSGKKEPTDLNALIKEYVNLSYHGMRAGNNPIDVTIKLDLDPDIREVSLIKEDFSRVVINLCNNAFDAMKFAVKPQNIAAQRAASLRVRTKKTGDSITIEIEDNGPGIPDAIKDKILQPFFTTKKGTEGTGLGLSITHDIVKAHGGEIKVVSRENEGSMFTIQFPIS